MKIVRVFPVFQTDILYAEHYLARELKKSGHETVFITSDKYLSYWMNFIKRTDGIGKHQFDDYCVIRLSSFFPFEKAVFKNWIKLYKSLFHNNFDVAHLSGLGNISTIIVLILASIRGKKSPPIIISDHSNPIAHKREGTIVKMYYRFLRFGLFVFRNKIKRVITFSQVGIDTIIYRFKLKESLFTIIPLGFDQSQFSYKPELKNQHCKLIIGFAGKVTPSKRIDFLINTIGNSGFSKDIKIIIVGVTPGDRYCDYLKSISKNYLTEIDFIDFLSSPDLANFYNYIDLAVFPGSISITTIEANGCGTPVLLFKSIESLSERVKDERGFLFSNESEFLEYIHYYLRVKPHGIDNYKIAENTKKELSWGALKDRYLELYNLAVNKG